MRNFNEHGIKVECYTVLKTVGSSSLTVDSKDLSGSIVVDIKGSIYLCQETPELLVGIYVTAACMYIKCNVSKSDVYIMHGP